MRPAGWRPLYEPPRAAANSASNCLLGFSLRVSVVRGIIPFTLGPLRRAVFFTGIYCPNRAIELFSMCSRMPGMIDPVFS
jgi:hypothetical protein